MKFIKKHLVTILLTLTMLVGISLLLYPTVSNWWNSLHQTRAIASYVETVEQMSEADYEKLWADARAYNLELSGDSRRWLMTDEEQELYESLLDVEGNGIMGYVEIPSLHLSLPFYHGVEDSVLQVAAGHIVGTSLPVGGGSTHCVLSGHRGLPAAKLFTDLDQMKVGDLFTLRVLDETLTYEVEKISIILPEEISALEIRDGEDLCTLMTCTPYGINTHRLLVTGRRTENPKEEVKVVAEAVQIDPLVTASVAAVPLLLILVLLTVRGTQRKKHKNHREK